MVDAFFAGARNGDLDALVAVLDPGVVLRTDGGTARPDASAVVRGAAAVARRTLATAQPAALIRLALVNGAAAAVLTLGEQPVAVIGFTVSRGKITEIDAITDSGRLRGLVSAVW